jgi:hypothetical protein
MQRLVMKTSLKFVPLFLAVSLPSAFAVELAGVSLPTGLDSFTAFAAFVASLVIMVAWSDYSQPRRQTISAAVATSPSAQKAAHPLAA